MSTDSTALKSETASTGEDSAPRPYGGKSAEQRQKARRRQLVEAGVKLIGQQGFASVSIDAVCAEAKLTKRYFYEAFSSRDALLTACYDSATRDMLQDILKAAAPHLNDARKLVRAGLEGTFGFVKGNPDKARLIMIEAMSVRGQLGEIYGERYDRFVDLLLQFTRPFLSGQPPEERLLRVIAKGVIGAIIHLCQNWIANGCQQPVEDLIDGVEQIMGGVGHAIGVKGWA